MGSIGRLLTWVAVTGLILSFDAALSFAAQIPLTIIHTNDIHSHYRPSRGPYGLGGIARVSTLIDRIRKATPNSLLFDGGDWSEGNIYYNLDAGRTAFEMLNAMGYDATVFGNHDWLNGPDHLIDLFKHAPPNYYVVGANLDYTEYKRASELPDKVAPYHIFEVGGLKVGVIGVVTWELIYDKYIDPVNIQFPYPVVRKLAAKLKNELGVDLVVVISHNSWGVNKWIAGLANVDVVIHAHDHQKYAQPIKVERNGKTSIAVEAGQWGEYVGRLDLVVDTTAKSYTVKHYELTQIDDTIPDDPKIAAMVDRYEQELTQKFGNILHDHVADTEVDLWQHENNEGIWGNLLTDAYRAYSGADVAFEQVSLTAGSLYRGPISSSDIFNALTAVYNPVLDRAWTLTTTRMTGKTLYRLMNKLLAVQSFIPDGIVNVSGMHAVWDPTVLNKNGNILVAAQQQVLHSLEIGGAPIDLKRSYLVALPHGIVETLSFIKEHLNFDVERSEETDTRVEDWRILANYLSRNTPIRAGSIPRGGRISVVQSDAAIYADEMSSMRRGAHFVAKVKIRNLGSTASSARKLTLTYDNTPRNVVDDPNPSRKAALYDVPPIPAGGAVDVEVAIDFPAEFAQEKVPVYLDLDHTLDDPEPSNDTAWFFSLP